MSKCADDGENYEAAEDTGTTVDQRNDGGVAQAVVIEFVEAGHGDQSAPRRTQGEENLNKGFGPNL